MECEKRPSQAAQSAFGARPLHSLDNRDGLLPICGLQAINQAPDRIRPGRVTHDQVRRLTAHDVRHGFQNILAVGRFPRSMRDS